MARKEEINVKLKHGSIEWKNFIKYGNHQGFNKVELVSCSEQIIEFKEVEKLGKTKEKAIKSYKDIDIPDFVVNEVNEAFGEKEKLSEVDLLRKQIEDLKNRLDKSEEKTESKPEEKIEVSESLQLARKNYQDKFGKKPHHSWTEEKIEELINS